MEVDTVNRYRSRILREMNANRENPFNSPPSSTGSHGTVSPTMSSLFSDPEGESTRRLNEDIARVTAPRKLPVNWDAAHRKWPEYFSKPKSANVPIYEDTLDARPLSAQSKENRPPVSSFKYINDESTQDAWGGSNRRRSEMQPRADNESELSLIMSKSPSAVLAKYGMAKHQHRHHAKRASMSPKYGNEKHMSGANGSQLSSARSSLTAVPPSPGHSVASASPGQNARSFFMPDVSHLGDFVTGTLRFSGSMKNGVPIFVKQGKVHDEKARPAVAAHAAVDGLQIPEDEEKIFVSMDMIREEIVSLQEHHEKIQEYALSLQQQVESLESQLVAPGSYKPQDFKPSVGQNAQLQLEVASLQSRLEQASRKLSTSEITSDTLVHERDRVITRLQEACDDINKLTRKLSIKDKELETSGQIKDDNEQLQKEIATLRSENERLTKENKSLSSKHSSLEHECEGLRESLDQVEHELDAAREEVETARQDIDTAHQEASALREDNDGLVRHNDKYFNDNKVLRVENKAFERRVAELQDEVDLLKEQLDSYRPRDDASMTHRTEKTDNMTSGFFVPDITFKKGQHPPTEPTETGEVPPPNEYTTDFDTQEGTERTNHTQPANGQKVSFALPLRSAMAKTTANQGSKRRNVHPPTPYKANNAVSTDEDTTGMFSVDNATQDQAIELSIPPESLTPKGPSHGRSHSRSQSRQQKPVKSASAPSITMDMTAASAKTMEDEVCHALSTDARRVLNNLCEHSCKNCTVCSRISAHRGTVSATDMAVGKKRVNVPRPVPVTDRDVSTEDPTMRPAQSPGHALALVIKGLEDESRHMQFELSRLQSKYNSSDKSIGKRDRVTLAESIRTLLKRLEMKNDQIYSLYDVLEGQKAAGQAMTEEELEMTVLNITGMTVRDVTGGSEQLTWDGIEEQ